MSRIIAGRPSAWTWILAALIVIALLWVVFAAIARTRGSRNDTLPRANIPAASMVAQAGPGLKPRPTTAALPQG